MLSSVIGLDLELGDEPKVVLTYFMPVIYFSQEDLNEIDLKIERLLTERGARHPQQPEHLALCGLVTRRAWSQTNQHNIQRDQDQGCNTIGN